MCGNGNDIIMPLLIKTLFMLIHLQTEPETEIYREDDGPLEHGKASQFSLNLKWYHLYRLSDDAIQKGDWYLFWMIDGWELMQCQDDEEATRCNHHFLIAKNCKKIVETTNKSLLLPTFSWWTVEDYINNLKP
jgi:hypothetical protein